MADWRDGWDLVGLFELKQNAAASRKLPDAFFDPDRILFPPQMFPRLADTVSLHRQPLKLGSSRLCSVADFIYRGHSSTPSAMKGWNSATGNEGVPLRPSSWDPNYSP